MRNLLLFMLATILAVPGFAQLNCSNVNAALSLSASGGLVTLTNSSVPTSTSNISTFYAISWGDNSSSYAYSNSNVTHTYNTSGTYTVTMYSQVHDSINNITCYDTATSNITVTTSLNCNNVNANFNAYVSGGNLGVLNNTSTPVGGPGLSVQYIINWGDGSSPVSTPSKTQQTHLYTSNGTYTIKLHVIAHDSNNSITCVDSTTKNITIGGGSPLNCNNVNVMFSKSVSGSTATIVNNSTPNPGSGITASYKFYWGDGSTTTKSNKTNTNHTYAANGMYTIKLVATYSAGSVTCIDSLIDSVNINVTPPNYISGMVYFDSSLVNQSDSVMIWLITFDSTTNLLTAVDSQRRPAYYPLYYFQNKAAGQYRTKAHLLNQASGSGYVPTYHDSDLLWSNADVINHTGGSTANKHIYLKTGTVTSGPGFVGGNVSQGANKGTANGIEGMNIFLLDANNEPVAFAVTDANGDYSFGSLPVGGYTVHPENINYNTTPASLNISLTQVAFVDINFERSNSQKTIVPITSGISNINNSAVAFTAYPNPASDVININWASLSNDMATISITDISGKKVYQSEVKMDANAAINISNIRPGFYFMNVQTESGSNIQKLLIQ